MGSRANAVVFVLWTISEFLYCNCLTILKPIDAEVIEGNNITLECKVLSANVNTIRWSEEFKGVTAFLEASGTKGPCDIPRAFQYFASFTWKYSFYCAHPVYRVTIKNIKRAEHNTEWSCFRPGDFSGPVSTIKVQVPVSSVSVSPPQDMIDIKENTAIEFTCKTSEARPKATVTWYKVKSGVTSHIDQNITSSTTNDEFSITTSTLRFVPSRQHNGVRIFCQVSNVANTSPVQSSETTFNVLLPVSSVSISPSKDTIDIKENTAIEFTCQTSEARPHATVTWYKVKSGVTSHIDQNITSSTTYDEFSITTSTLRFVPSRQHNGVRIFCQVSNVANTSPVQSSETTFNVLSAPDSPLEFRYVKDLTTTTSIHLEWKPGYNGGLPQTFHIIYVLRSSSTLHYANIDDTGEDVIEYTLTGLSEEAQYELVIYASNKIGSTSKSSILSAHTKGNETTNNSSLIGGVVGGVIGVMIIVVVVVLLIRRHNIFKVCLNRYKHDTEIEERCLDNQ
ncbi:hypothetical protein ACF0H5_000727 [Mactra antiquata]